MQYPIEQRPLGTPRSAHDSQLLQDVELPKDHKPANLRRKANLRSAAVLAVLVPGLFATVALPAYGAVNSSSAESNATAAGTLTAAQNKEAQSVVVSAAAAPAPTITRSTFKFVAPKRTVSHGSFTGLRSFGAVNLSGVAGIAARYLGVPYVFGGESTRGFDCSGLVAYVYAQVGVRLPHSSKLQGEMGTRIPYASARPGDVLVFNGGSHVGIYIGGGKMIDAPYPGRVVSIDRIYTTNFWVVRY